MEGVNEASLQQVQDLNGAITGTTDYIVVGRVKGKAIDASTMDWMKKYKLMKIRLQLGSSTYLLDILLIDFKVYFQVF